MSNSIWKTPDQIPEPDARRWIYEKPSPIFPYGVSYRHTITAGYLVKAEWAYIDDLIAQADKAERLQKAVDYAVKEFTELMNSFDEEDEVAIEIAEKLSEIKQLIKETTNDK